MPMHFLITWRVSYISQEKCTGVTFKVYTKKNEGKCWIKFYKYIKWHKGNKEEIATIKDGNGWLITDSTEKLTLLIYIILWY
jgi:hypothetical protein